MEFYYFMKKYLFVISSDENKKGREQTKMKVIEDTEKTIFVGNRITMEGIYVKLPKQIESSKAIIEDAIYDIFYGVFTEKVNRNFIKTMKMNKLLDSFIEHHLKCLFDIYTLDIIELNKNNDTERIKSIVESYFINSVEKYHEKIMKVTF